jgi:hypothetical protein
MWRQGATPDDVIGYIIDYGNSRHLEENRIQARGHDSNGLMLLCEDDARSVTVLYQSIQSLQADKLTKEYANIKPQLDEAERKYQEELSQASDQDLPEKSMDTLALESRVNRCLAAAIKVKHRYTDDLESILYSFLHLVSVSRSETNSTANIEVVISTVSRSGQSPVRPSKNWKLVSNHLTANAKPGNSNFLR